MAKIILKDAFYSPFQDEHIGKSIKENAREINSAISAHITRIGANDTHSYADAGHHYFCSTMMDAVFSAGSIDSKNIVDSGYDVAQSFTNAYECACWGYCVRYHFDYKRHQKYFAISILDINAMEMDYWSSNEQWGKSGFGITTLFFEIDDDNEHRDLIHTGVASGGNNIISFASFAKGVAKTCQADTISLPFFPDNMSIPVRRSLKNTGQLTEYHATYGHAFGSDPWIAFIRDHQQESYANKNIVFGSLALRGYYCFADINIANNVNTQHF